MCVYSVLLCVSLYSFKLSLLLLTLPPPPPPPHTHTHTYKASSPLSYLVVRCYTADKNAEAAGEGCSWCLFHRQSAKFNIQRMMRRKSGWSSVGGLQMQLIIIVCAWFHLDDNTH